MARDGFTVEAAIAKGRKLPDWVEEEPPLGPLDSFFLRAFDDLNTCRHDGGPIPWRDIMLYGKEAGYGGSTSLAFIRIMREMDIGYLKWHNKDKPKIGKARRHKDKPKTPPRRARQR